MGVTISSTALKRRLDGKLVGTVNSRPTIVVKMSLKNELVGSVNQNSEKHLSGTLRNQATLNADLSSKGELSGSIMNYISSDIAAYKGPYQVVPELDNDITLETKDKKMNDNVTVGKIPLYETSNISGGKTVYIGGLI